MVRVSKIPGLKVRSFDDGPYRSPWLIPQYVEDGLVDVIGLLVRSAPEAHRHHRSGESVTDA